MGKGSNQSSNKNWLYRHIKNWFNWLTWKTEEDSQQLIQMNINGSYRSDVEVGDIRQENEPENTWISSFWKGVLLSALSGLSFTFNTAIFKFANCDPVDTMFIRSIFQILVLTSWNKFCKNQFFFGWTKDQALVLIQAFASSFFVFATYGAMMSLQQGDAMTIIMASPFFTSK